MALHFRIFCHNPKTGDHLRQVIEATGSGRLVEANDLTQLPPAGINDADIALVEYQEGNPQLDQWIAAATADPNNPAIFLVFPEVSMMQLLKSLHLGVKECFALPVAPEEFQEAVNRLLVRTSLKPPARDTTRPKTIAFLGSKGGLGTTFLVANLAYLLAREHQGQVLLLDLDLTYGQLVHFFDIKPQHSLSEAVAHLEELDQSFLQNLLYPYNKFLSLLPAPSRLEEAESVTAEHLGKVLAFVREMPPWRWILLDAGHRMDELTVKVLEQSDNLVLVTSPLVPALANARKWFELLQLLEIKLPVDVWLNAWDKSSDLSKEEVAAYLGLEVRGAIPFDLVSVNRSINDGHPLAETSAGHPICQAIRTLASNIVGTRVSKEAAPAGWGWLKRLGGRS